MMKKVLSWVMFATLICGNMLLMSCSDDNDNSGHEQPTLSECTIIFYGIGGRNLDADIYENLRQLYRGLRDNSNIDAVVFFKNSFNPNPDMLEELDERGFDFHKATAYRFVVDKSQADNPGHSLRRRLQWPMSLHPRHAYCYRAFGCDSRRRVSRRLSDELC